KQMSLWRNDSELTQFNQSKSLEWMAVSPETARVVAAAIEISRATQGAFDPTVSPLVRLWNFGPDVERRQIPTDAELAEARRHVGTELLEVRLSPPALKKLDPDLHLDLNAIAKGDAVDRVADLLDTLSPGGYMVEIGGEMRTRGTKENGAPWSIGIEAPMADRRVVHSIVPLRDAALATSGNYRNFVEVDGQRISHTIDPRTGRPASHDLASVSVIAADCMTADAWATALMVLGPDEGLSLAESNQVEALFLVWTGDRLEERTTSGFPAAHELSHDFQHVLETAGGTWIVFLLAAAVFGIAVVGMAIGVILSNRRLKGSCGGLEGLKDTRGNPLCESCTQPAQQCSEFREKQGVSRDSTPHSKSPAD
ncbi:MAG: FAD:protein FMN transferase, partial [Planctomycetaceae bacterium]|nr:FAD:protein FMN transferase [Planctomycetaceae bacterium]